jgi:glycosyltransferase involved in cell wall biosynthesis
MQDNKAGRIKISACMMVKDEERHLPRCLESIKHFADEIIVVDTGSTDRTVKIAESYSADVYHHPWENDFSKHRNQSIEYATGDWIFIIDADEELIYEQDNSIQSVRSLLSQWPKDYQCAAIALQDIQRGIMAMQFNTTRLFRRGKVVYEGIVHNQPSVKDSDATVFIKGIHIKHYGYDLTPEEKERKTNRTVSLLMKRLEGNPEDYQCFFYLAQLYAANSNFKECVKWGEKYLNQKDKIMETSEHNFNNSMYYTIVKNYMKLGDVEKTKFWLEQALQNVPGDIDIALGLLEFGVWTKRKELVMLGGQQYLNARATFNEDPTIRQNRFIYTNNNFALSYIYYHLAMVYLKEGTDMVKAMKNVLQDTQPQYRDGMLAETGVALNQLGLKDFSSDIVNLQELSELNAPLRAELEKVDPEGFGKIPSADFPKEITVSFPETEEAFKPGG